MKIPRFYYENVYNSYEDSIRDRSASIRKYHRGNPIYTMVESKTYYYYICSGMVALYMTGESGEKKMLLICGPGMIFPVYRQGVDYKTNYNIFFEAKDSVTAYYFSEQKLGELMNENPQLTMCTLNTALDILDWYTFSLMDSAYNDSLKKISNILVLIGKQVGKGRTGEKLFFSHDELAAASGCSRPQTTKQLGYLNNKKIIATHRGYFEILDFERLEALCSKDVVSDEIAGKP